MHDLVILGGTLIDGSGAPRATDDVAIDAGRITQAGGKAGRNASAGRDCSSASSTSTCSTA